MLYFFYKTINVNILIKIVYIVLDTVYKTEWQYKKDQSN